MIETNVIRLKLPFPPSTNHYLRSRVIKGAKPISMTYVSKVGKQFQKDVRDSVIEQIGLQHIRIVERVSLEITFHRKDARSYDISNFVKSTEDALTKAGVWLDDEQVDRILLIRGAIDRTNPRAEVTISIQRQETEQKKLF